ncbi:popeye domain-containing protein 3-like [Macrosteles quadrilineatus]|uniref:popeye domain-containing protein 3-like n=1 Tax=Macrosteles quadrilineatus TaxID=74068 RepID=UPI0023E34125|nr:popeye domain-containing protein 3-like [Macrosteles quadrilineatus]
MSVIPGSITAGRGLSDRGATVVQIYPGENQTWQEGPFNYTTYLGMESLGWCEEWREPQHIVFQLANICCMLSYSSPTNRYGIVFMHFLLIIGYFMFCVWAWSIVCAPDVFVWNLCFTLLNLFQLIYVLYQMRPVKFDPELEEVYHTLFRPFKVTRMQFKKLVCNDLAQIMSLHAGEAYAMQNLTRTDRLGLLLTGKVNVLSDQQFLHPILPCEFLDSPEFESRANMDDKFKVSIVAATSCRYLYWMRTTLEYLFVKETYLATVMSTLVARDITTKLYAMNNKIVTEKGFHLDIRLPSITSTLNVNRDRKSPSFKALLRHSTVLSGGSPKSPESVSNSRERLLKSSGQSVPNGRLVEEMTPLKELPSTDDLASNTEVESWLESSSKFHSCEVVDD